MNCVTFVAGWIERLTGEDPIADLRGAIDDGRGRVEELRAGLEARLGEPVHPSRAQRGDVAYCERLGACGIYFTSGPRMVALLLGDGGFSLYRARETDLAFRVVDRPAGWQRTLNDYVLEVQEVYERDGFSWEV